MHDILRFTVLGCGSSPGVPRPNNDWGSCDPQEPKNQRYRASLLIERINAQGLKTTVVIDTGPDFRSQMIMANVNHIDAVVYTHAHADHVHGIDDLRTYVYQSHKLMDIYAEKNTLARLHDGFGYCFKTPEGSNYPPILKAHEIYPYKAFSIMGEGGEIQFEPFTQIHGDIISLGFRIGSFAYCTDVNRFPEESVAYLQNLDVIILDALQYNTHPSHFSLDQALGWIERIKVKRAILTHMHIPLDYQTIKNQTPDNVEPAYNGLSFEMPIR